MAEIDKYNSILERYGAEIVEKLRYDIRNKKITRFGAVNASGKLANSLRYEVKGGKLRVYALGYAPVMETGRKGGKRPPVSAIEQWLSDKGIAPQGISKKSLAYLIARKIGKEGTEIYKQGGSDLISGVINQQLIDHLQSDLATSFSEYSVTSIANAIGGRLAA